MTAGRVLGLLAALALAACSTYDAGTGSEDVESPEPEPVVDNGQTGSMGLAECTEHYQCVEAMQLWLAGFEMPAIYWHTFDASECHEVQIAGGPDLVQGLACSCTVHDSDGGLNVGPQSLGCSNVGRRRDCIYHGDEFPGCDPEDPTSCQAICEDLEARIEADAMITYETEIRSARCQDYHCKSVVRIGDSCYPGPAAGVFRPYDCALSDAEILAAAEE